MSSNEWLTKCFAIQNAVNLHTKNTPSATKIFMHNCKTCNMCKVLEGYKKALGGAAIKIHA